MLHQVADRCEHQFARRRVIQRYDFSIFKKNVLHSSDEILRRIKGAKINNESETCRNIVVFLTNLSYYKDDEYIFPN